MQELPPLWHRSDPAHWPAKWNTNSPAFTRAHIRIRGNNVSIYIYKFTILCIITLTILIFLIQLTGFPLDWIRSCFSHLCFQVPHGQPQNDDGRQGHTGHDGKTQPQVYILTPGSWTLIGERLVKDCSNSQGDGASCPLHYSITCKLHIMVDDMLTMNGPTVRLSFWPCSMPTYLTKTCGSVILGLSWIIITNLPPTNRNCVPLRCILTCQILSTPLIRWYSSKLGTTGTSALIPPSLRAIEKLWLPCRNIGRKGDNNEVQQPQWECKMSIQSGWCLLLWICDSARLIFLFKRHLISDKSYIYSCWFQPIPRIYQCYHHPK